MRSKELLRRRRNRWDGQAKLRMRHYQDLASNWILVRLKITVLLCHTQDQLFHGFGRILLVIHLWIIVGCIYNHIIFNILLCIQIIFHKDRLAIIWSKKTLIVSKRVRRTWRKIQSTYSRGGVPQAYLTLKREGYNICKQESMEQQVEVEPIKPIVMKKVWRSKQIISSLTWGKIRHGR